MKTTNINSILYVEVVNYFRGLLKESIQACDKEDVITYKETTLEDYYGGCWDLYHQDGEDIEGINIISEFIVLNDDTRSELERAFEQARDEEFEAFINECYYYTGQPNVLYADEFDAIEAADTDFRNDIAANNTARYFDEDCNETDAYREDFKKYTEEKIMPFYEVEQISTDEIQEIR